MSRKLIIKAPAKLNLTLEVLRKREDGYHEIRSVIQTIDLCDTLRFEMGEGISFKCDMEGWSAEASLVSKAAQLVKEDAGDKGASITIEKRIPLLSGLGGDSSDAAAVLIGLNHFWKLGLPPERLREMAAQLGSDVFFFLQGGTALVGGRGEQVTSLPPPPVTWVVLVVPDVPVKSGKTAGMYAGLKPGYFTDGYVTEKLVETLHKGHGFSPLLLFNTFGNVAFMEGKLLTYKKHLVKMGAPGVHLAGSGPTLYAMFSDKYTAGDFYTMCRDQGMQVYLAKTL